jgi:membrane protein YdbS with pleckstrin-like domain
MQETEFEIDREAVKRYFLSLLLLTCLACCCLPVFPVIVGTVENLLDPPDNPRDITLVLVFMLIGIPCVIITPFFLVGRWLCPQKAHNLRYRLEGSTLRVDDGVFFLSRKSIPLERISDVALAQGPLLRYYGIWAVRIQTTGSACEATLYGVREPEKIRELILSHRRCACHEKTDDA